MNCGVLPTADAINAQASAEGAATVTPDVVAASTGCSSYWVQLSATNVSHSTVWTYKETEYACYNGSRVTYIWGVAQISGKVYAWAQALGWSYMGIMNKNVWDYYGNHWVYAAWTQGSFKYCPYRLGYCPQNPTPQLEMYIYGRRARRLLRLVTDVATAPRPARDEPPAAAAARRMRRLVLIVVAVATIVLAGIAVAAAGLEAHTGGNGRTGPPGAPTHSPR